MKCYMCANPILARVIPVRKMGEPDNRVYLCSPECFDAYKETNELDKKNTEQT